MTIADAPRTELGYPGGIAPTFGSGYGITGGGSGGFYVEGLDANIDLRFPASAVIYDRMRREDGQVASVMRAITHPIISTAWRLVGDDVRPEVMAFVANELGLNRDEGRARRRREGIVWRDHLREALLMLPFGFMPFEVVYQPGPAAPGLEDPAQPGKLYAHLRKLGPRLPRTVEQIRVGRDGGLAGIVQAPAMNGPGGNPLGVFIPVDRLVMYVNDREGADWAGNSVLRSAYKHWLIKDALIRLGAQIVERNGMGIPIVTYKHDADEGKALRLAKSLRAGAEAGGAMKEGMTVSLVGVTGQTADELERVKYHDEAVGRSLLAMFLNLGHDNGARALGATFVDYFLLFLEAIIYTIQETATEHIIRDLVELNYGPDEPYPAIVADKLSAEATPTAEALKNLADAGLLTPDRELEADIRRRYLLPAKPAPTGDGAVEDAAGSPVAQVGIPALIAAGVLSPDEGRVMLKLPGRAPGPPTDADTVPVPAALSTNLSAYRPVIRATLGLDSGVPAVTTALAQGDETLARLEALTARYAALREGHGVPVP